MARAAARAAARGGGGEGEGRGGEGDGGGGVAESAASLQAATWKEGAFFYVFFHLAAYPAPTLVTPTKPTSSRPPWLLGSRKL